LSFAAKLLAAQAAGVLEPCAYLPNQALLSAPAGVDSMLTGKNLQNRFQDCETAIPD
jgi:hypothetical protein